MAVIIFAYLCYRLRRAPTTNGAHANDAGHANLSNILCAISFCLGSRLRETGSW